MHLANYLEQHNSIRVELKAVRELMAKNDLENNTREIALHISTLAGKIKIHLLAEDKYLYPELLDTEDPQLKKMAKDYQDEMGGLADHFTKFKDTYNTPIKIMKNKSSIESDINNMLTQIEMRITKEENELYKMLK